MDYSINKNLLQGLRDNDYEAFKHLYKTSFRAVLSIAINTSRSKEDAEDLYNDGIIVLLERINKPGFVLNGKIQGMLYAICKKKNSNFLRQETSRKNYLNANFEDRHEDHLDEKMDQALYRSIFRNSLKKLKKDCQEIIDKLMDELSPERIAKDMGISLLNLRQKKSRCLEALRLQIAANPEYKILLKNDEIR